jgi:two-component system, OmpR family, sensor kinase
MRSRLAAAIALVTLAALAGSFFALHQRTGSDLERRIDANLREQFVEFQHNGFKATDTPAEVAHKVRAFIASQRYNPESQIILIAVNDGPLVTNEKEVVAKEVERRDAEAGRERGASLLDAPEGFADVSTEEAGRLRVYSRPIDKGGRRLALFRAADPRESITRAQSALRNTFLLVGAVALVLAGLVAAWLATLITRPLRRIASVASGVGGGDLSDRIGPVRSSDEVEVLADSFDHMLDRLEAAFRRQREFVSDASHELRTPLTVLRGQTELLRRLGDDPEERRRVTETLLRELDQTNRLVSDMLALAQAESGELVRPRAVDLDEYLQDLERDLPLLGDREYRLEGTHRGTLEADPERLTQVFRNLVRNAVRHTGRGDRVTLSAEARDGRIEFAVADDGPGIPTDQLERVFDRFHRTDEARDRDHGGSGLGLPIARAIVEAHGGRIWAESPPRGGARIRFELPRYRSR